MLELSLNQEEENVNKSQLSTDEIALALKVIVSKLQSILKQVINVVVLVYISLNMPVCLIAHCAGEWLHLQSENV